MKIQEATSQAQWDQFLGTNTYRPFMQSWTMGEVHRDIGEQPIRLEVIKDDQIVGICQALVVDARRGKHLVVPYGPVIGEGLPVIDTDHRSPITSLISELQQKAAENDCSFIRISPFWPADTDPIPGSKPSPLHLLAEHVWYIPLIDPVTNKPTNQQTILSGMRKNTRNLIRRAEKEGVTITKSGNPVDDLDTFIELHEETRKRHSFTPYTNDFFRAQVQRFSERGECTMYQAHYQSEVIASSIHMHAFGETSYHHGASTHKYSKIPASYLLQWTAIQDALKRGDHMYSFWGIAPVTEVENGKWKVENAKPHPFAGVTTFKMGFGGQLLNLIHCMDVPVSKKYYLTRGFEMLRKWERGF